MIKYSLKILNYARNTKKPHVAFSQFKDTCYYGILNVSVDAKTETIRKQFFKLAKEFHPDVAKDEKSKEIFQAIAEAYGVLTSEELRTEYDKTKGYNKFQERTVQEDEFTANEDYVNRKSNTFDAIKAQKEVDELNDYFKNKYFDNKDKSTKDPLNPVNFDMGLFEAKEQNNAKAEDDFLLYKPGTLHQYAESKEEVKNALNPYLGTLYDSRYLIFTFGILWAWFINASQKDEKAAIKNIPVVNSIVDN